MRVRVRHGGAAGAVHRVRVGPPDPRGGAPVEQGPGGREEDEVGRDDGDEQRARRLHPGLLAKVLRVERRGRDGERRVRARAVARRRVADPEGARLRRPAVDAVVEALRVPGQRRRVRHEARVGVLPQVRQDERIERLGIPFEGGGGGAVVHPAAHPLAHRVGARGGDNLLAFSPDEHGINFEEVSVFHAVGCIGGTER